MKRRILYYPSIDIKDGVWLRNAILYWEEVSSIMPYQSDDYNISPEISYLMNTGNFVPTRPDEIMFSELNEDFIEEVRLRFNEYQPSIHNHGRRQMVHRSKIEPDYYRLHNSKLSSHVMEMIEGKSEVINSENGQWISIDSQLSDIYMSILAKYLAAISHADTSIGTDTLINQDQIIKPESHIGRNNRQSFLNYQFNILPVPNTDVSFEEILEFKEHRKDELRRLRVEIDELENRLLNAEDKVTIKRIWIEFEDRLESSVKDLNRVMKEYRWMIRPSVMNGLVSMTVPGVISTAEMFGASFSPIQKGIGLAAGTVLSIGLVAKDIGGIRREALAENPFAYIYHAKRARML